MPAHCQMIAVCLTLLLPFTAFAQDKKSLANQLPADTDSVIMLNLADVSPADLRQTLQLFTTLQDNDDPENREESQQLVDAVIKYHTSMREAGVEQILFSTASGLTNDGIDPENVDWNHALNALHLVYVVNESFDLQKVNDSLSAFRPLLDVSDQEEFDQLTGAFERLMAGHQRIGDDWVVVRGNRRAAKNLEPEKAGQYRSAIGDVKDRRSVTFAYVATDENRLSLREAAVSNPIVGNFLLPLIQMNWTRTAMTLGEKPHVDIVLEFSTPNDAAAFRESVAQATMFISLFVQGAYALDSTAKTPEAEQAEKAARLVSTKIAAAFLMHQEGSTLRTSLNSELFEAVKAANLAKQAAEKVAPAAESPDDEFPGEEPAKDHAATDEPTETASPTAQPIN